MTIPKRIQRRRTRGYKMPSGAIYVGRPTVWGNPFLEVQKRYGPELAMRLYAELVSGGWNPSIVAGLPDSVVAQIYAAHQAWLKRIGSRPFEAIIDLRGHDLACWCPLSEMCHADILLELATGRVS